MTPRLRRAAAALLAFGALATAGCAQLGELDLGGLLGPQPLDEATVTAGLRQALEVGAGRAASGLSRAGAFLDDPALRIPLPEELSHVALALQALGLGREVEAFEAQMSRAAELAAGEAVAVFAEAVRGMTVADAFGILDGGPTAATDFFRERTRAPLRARFAPVVESAMNEVGLYELYRELTRRYDALPFAKAPAPDLGDWITDRTLAALFSRLGDEERLIRQDPVARTTELLRRVFEAGARRVGAAAG